MDKQVVFFLKITPKPEFYERLRSAILDVIPKVLKEPGVRVFNLHESLTDEDKSLYLYEVFDSQEAYNFYIEQSYTQAIKLHFKEWLASPIEAVKLSKIS